jgi:beta-galactosidase
MKLLVSLLLFVVAISAQTNDPFLQLRHDKLHDSPAQQQFRRLAPMPAGVVYIQQPSEGEREMREHFRTMKRLGPPPGS